MNLLDELAKLAMQEPGGAPTPGPAGGAGGEGVGDAWRPMTPAMLGGAAHGSQERHAPPRSSTAAASRPLRRAPATTERDTA